MCSESFFFSCFTYLYIYYLFIVSYYFCLLFYSLLYLYIFKALSDANMQFIVSQWILLYHILPFYLTFSLSTPKGVYPGEVRQQECTGDVPAQPPRPVLPDSEALH